MIESVRLVNFKNFADETLNLGPFTVIVGANASGKSNIRDAFRFLHGIGRGYTLAEILGGKYGPGGYREWEGIRGAPGELTRFEHSSSQRSHGFSFQVKQGRGKEKVIYSIETRFNPRRRSEGFRVLEEELKTVSDTVYLVGKGGRGSSRAISVGDDKLQRIGVSRTQPALSQFLESGSRGAQFPHHEERVMYAGLGEMRFLEMSPERMREPSVPGATMLGDYGQNLPSVLEEVCADSQRGRNLMSWLQELTPMDVKDFEFPRDPSGRIHLHIVERNGRKVSAYSASDGTLRFLGILAALLDPNEGGLYFFEEIDNGIHPSRLWLLLDLIEQQTAEGNIQIVTTTHSPALLAWMSDTTFENTSVVYRDQYWADSVIRPIAGLYNLRELRESQGLERLLTSGWFETAMKFSEGDSDSDHLDDDEDDWEEGVLE